MTDNEIAQALAEIEKHKRTQAKIENSKALVLDMSTVLAELEEITRDMAIYWAGFRVDHSLDTSPLDAGYRTMQNRQAILRQRLVRLVTTLQAAHQIVDPKNTKGRNLVDIAERIAREAEERLP